MKPKVEFKWSWIYEQEYHAPGIKSKEFNLEKYDKEIKKFISKIKSEWEKVEEKVFLVLSKESGLSWKEEKIFCYVIKQSTFFPISDPLTIPISLGDKDTFTLTSKRYIDMLVHELIHNLLIQNEKESDGYFEKVFNIYKKEKFNTVIHLLIHALHEKVMKSVFNEERLNEEIGATQCFPDYKRSWEIVLEKGSDKIIKEFKETL
jgi:hypothetical protein